MRAVDWVALYGHMGMLHVPPGGGAWAGWDSVEVHFLSQVMESLPSPFLDQSAEASTCTQQPLYG